MRLSPKNSERAKRLSNFWKLFRKSKLGLLGLVMLAFFVSLAALAPFLTPYDPYKGTGISSAIASPSWMTLFDSKLAPDAYLIPDSLMTTPQSFQSFSFSAAVGGNTSQLVPGAMTATSDKWSVMNGSQVLETVTVSYLPGRSNGSLQIAFDKLAPFTGQLTLSVSKTFQYSSPPPPKFRVIFDLWLQKTSTASYRTSVSMTNPEGKTFNLWDSFNKYNSVVVGGQGLSSNPLPVSSYSIDSYLISPQAKILYFGSSVANAASGVFNTTGTYKVGVAFVFAGQSTGTESATFNLSGLQVRIDGSASGLLGTDQLGRDIFTQLVYGTKWALFVGVLAALIGVALGMAVGLVAGYVGSFVDEGLMRTADFVLVLPFIPFIIVLAVLIHPNIVVLTWIIALLGWPGIARLIRSLVLSLKARAFVEAAKASGAGTRYILLRHMVPNVSPIALTQMVLFIPAAIVTLTAVTFLGLGDPTIIDWGYMTNEAYQYGFRNWWWIVPPGILIALLSSSFLFIGFAMDQILNPRLRKR